MAHDLHAELHQARSVGGWSFSYDANGNLQSGQGRTYTWQADNLPASITGADGVTESYTYDADGERLARTRSGVTTEYVSGLWEEEIPSGTLRYQFTVQGQVIGQRAVTSTSNGLAHLCPL
ncbi:MAG: hypothetical protein M3R24_27175, partial [Chloroflexota bacterium]|nr:hypothetical protein [Chloroflexota bacterium]